MVAYYDEIEIEDMVWDEEKGVFHYPCPCGDRFEITKRMLKECEDVATCPSCSLIIRVIYDPLDYEDYESEEEQESDEEQNADKSDSDDEADAKTLVEQMENIKLA